MTDQQFYLRPPEMRMIASMIDFMKNQEQFGAPEDRLQFTVNIADCNGEHIGAILYSEDGYAYYPNNEAFRI